MDLQNLLFKFNDLNEKDLLIKLTSAPYHFDVEYKSNEKLYRIIYTDDSDFNIPGVRQAKGVIIEKETNKIICYGIDKCYDININSDDNEFDITTEEKCEIMDDGSIIKVYFYDNEWKYSTNRRIDARQAHWISDKSFYELFNEATSETSPTPLDYNLLNKKYVYLFILKHPENRLVTKYKYPTVTHLTTRNMETMEEVEENINIPHPKEICYTSYEDMLNEVRGYVYFRQGIVIKKGNMRIKITSPQYTIVKNVRGNTRNIKLRYIQLINKEDIHVFNKFFSEYTDEYNELMEELTNASQKIHRMYVKKYSYSNGEEFKTSEKYEEILKMLKDDEEKLNMVIAPKYVYNKIKSLESNKLGYLLNVFSFKKKVD